MELHAQVTSWKAGQFKQRPTPNTVAESTDQQAFPMPDPPPCFARAAGVCLVSKANRRDLSLPTRHHGENEEVMRRQLHRLRRCL
jgi:hypothetical protein